MSDRLLLNKDTGSHVEFGLLEIDKLQIENQNWSEIDIPSTTIKEPCFLNYNEKKVPRRLQCPRLR